MKLILRIKKRFFFEFSKKIKILRFYFFREWVVNLKNGVYSPNPVMTIDWINIDELYKEQKECREKSISDANCILTGKLNLIYEKNDKIIKEWNVDYDSGHVYPNKYYGLIEYIVKDEKTDVKNVWELSRLQHLVVVSKAYLITLDEKYLNYVKDSIISWVENNKYANSVNWTCNMEVAIRVTNLIVCYEMLKHKISEDNDFDVTFKTSIYYHNKYIVENLENYSDLRNNHYLANLMGLLISSKFLENKDPVKYKKYSRFSINEIQSEIDKQIYNDGVSYEISTSYQKLVFEILLISLLLGQSKGNQFKRKYVEKIHDMYVFLKSIQYAHGSIPLIGDNDSGNVLIFNNYYDKNRSNLLSLMNLSEFFFYKKSEIKDESTLFFNYHSYYQHAEEKNKQKYVDSGYYILKKRNISMIVICGPLSLKGQGGHSHNDQLSFVLSVAGRQVFIDPGTITYTGNDDLRNYSRSTSLHNTVQINDEEQNVIGSDLFSLKERTFSKCISYSDDAFEGIHKGYIERFNCLHKRNISLAGDQIIINDKLLTDSVVNNIAAKMNLVLSREVEVNEINGFIFLIFGEFQLTTNLKTEFCTIVDILVSERYGSYHKSKKIVYDFNGEFKLIMSLK